MKRKGWKYGWLVVLLGVLIVGYDSVSPVSLKAADQTIGVVTKLNGKAWMVSEMGELIKLEEGMTLALGNKLKCTGKLSIRFNTCGFLLMKPNTEVAISESGGIRILSGSADYINCEGDTLALMQGGEVIYVSQAPLDLTPTVTGVQAKVVPIFPYAAGGAPEPVEPASPSQ